MVFSIWLQLWSLFPCWRTSSLFPRTGSNTIDKWSIFRFKSAGWLSWMCINHPKAVKSWKQTSALYGQVLRKLNLFILWSLKCLAMWLLSLCCQDVVTAAPFLVPLFSQDGWMTVLTLINLSFVLSSISPFPPRLTPLSVCNCAMVDHIALIIELLGVVPRKLMLTGKYSKDFFTKKGNVAFVIHSWNCMHYN